MLKKAEGIVIRTRDYGETHQVLVIYTREQGKIAVMARGVKKTRSRLSSVAQVLTHGQYMYYAGSGMGTLTQGETIKSHHKIREDILWMSYAAYILELLDKLTDDREPNGFLFHLLDQVLSLLETGKDAAILCRIFEMKLLGISGYRPQVDACLNCLESDKPFFFSVSKGGFLCAHCLPLDEQALSLSPASARLLRLFLHVDIDRLGEIRVRPETNEQLERVMFAFTDYHADLHLKSRNFLQKMKVMDKKLRDI